MRLPLLLPLLLLVCCVEVTMAILRPPVPTTDRIPRIAKLKNRRRSGRKKPRGNTVLAAPAVVSGELD